MSTVFAALSAIMATVAFAKGDLVVPTGLQSGESEVYFDSAMLQARIKSEKPLTTVAMQHSAIGEEAIAFGFAAKSEEAKFFIIGSLYADALAHLRSGAADLAAKRLESIETELLALRAPSSLYNYISKMRNMIEQKRYDTEMIEEFMALFQPLWEDYTRSKGDDKLILFRAGSWLVDMSLIAGAQDTELLRQPVKAKYFTEAMKKLSAPKGVVEAFDQITQITEKQQIIDTDAKEVLKLVKQIQTILA
jgi:hypothetical protein